MLQVFASGRYVGSKDKTRMFNKSLQTSLSKEDEETLLPHRNIRTGYIQPGDVFFLHVQHFHCAHFMISPGHYKVKLTLRRCIWPRLFLRIYV